MWGSEAPGHTQCCLRPSTCSCGNYSTVASVEDDCLFARDNMYSHICDSIVYWVLVGIWYQMGIYRISLYCLWTSPGPKRKARRKYLLISNLSGTSSTFLSYVHLYCQFSLVWSMRSCNFLPFWQRVYIHCTKFCFASIVLKRVFWYSNVIRL